VIGKRNLGEQVESNEEDRSGAAKKLSLWGSRQQRPRQRATREVITSLYSEKLAHNLTDKKVANTLPGEDAIVYRK